MGLHSLPVSCLAWGDPALRSAESPVGFTVTSKPVPGRVAGSWPAAAVPPSLWRALLPHASTGDPPALAGGFGSVSYWGHCSFPLGVDVPRILFVPSKTGVSFPQSCGSPIIQSCWPSWPDFLGIPSPFVRSPDWETQRIPNLHNRGRTSLVFSFSSLWVSHVMCMGFDLIVIMSLLPSSLQLLCPWTRDLFFWWVPASCWWLFNS